MERRVEFFVDELSWFRMRWPEYADLLNEPGFKCTYAIREDERGNQFYELLTSDGRTNWNDLNAYERSCLWDCQKYFDNRLHIVGCPDYCMGMGTSDGLLFEYATSTK